MLLTPTRYYIVAIYLGSSSPCRQGFDIHSCSHVEQVASVCAGMLLLLVAVYDTYPSDLGVLKEDWVWLWLHKRYLSIWTCSLPIGTYRHWFWESWFAAKFPPFFHTLTLYNFINFPLQMHPGILGLPQRCPRFDQCGLEAEEGAYQNRALIPLDCLLGYYGVIDGPDFDFDTS